MLQKITSQKEKHRPLQKEHTEQTVFSLPTRCGLSPHHPFPGRLAIAFYTLPGLVVNKG